jgi:hypothetical protein
MRLTSHSNFDFFFFGLLYLPCLARPIQSTSKTTMSKALCFPFDKVYGGSLLGDASNVSTSTWLKLIVGNGEGGVEKRIEI